MSSASSSPPSDFKASPIPDFDKLPVQNASTASDGKKYVQNAAVLIIGDEVLNGKTRDSNSNFLAKMLFDLGVELKRIEVIADDEEEIAEAVRRMSKAYDLVVTSGGIG